MYCICILNLLNKNQEIDRNRIFINIYIYENVYRETTNDTRNCDVIYDVHICI